MNFLTIYNSETMAKYERQQRIGARVSPMSNHQLTRDQHHHHRLDVLVGRQEEKFLFKFTLIIELFLSEKSDADEKKEEG